MRNWNRLADDASISKVVNSLKANGVEVIVCEKGDEAKNKVLEMVPVGAEVMAMTSKTLDTLGLTKEFNESGKYNSVKAKLKTMDRATQDREMRKLGAAPDWAVGSVHAVTEDGSIFIASNTGSQLSAYIYAAGRVIWIVGTQKIVKDKDEAEERIYNYCLPTEDKRMKEKGQPGSFVSKILTINREVRTGRITLFLVKEEVGV